MTVTVVVGNYQGAAVLEDCLESLAQQTAPPVEVIVADAASTDDSRAIAEQHGARWLTLENNGLGYLYNRGADVATTTYVLFSNNDVAYDPRCLELLVAELEDDPSLFAADPRQVDWSGERLVHARTTLRRGRLFHELLPGFELDLAVPADRPVPTLMANGGAMLVRRDTFRELGGFDETFFLDVEDLDLCWRAWLRGHGSLYVPDAWLRHRVGATTSSAVRPRRLRSSHHNLVRFALKCLPFDGLVRVLGGELLRTARHPRVIAPALADVAAELPDILRERRTTRPSATFYRWVLAGMP